MSMLRVATGADRRIRRVAAARQYAHQARRTTPRGICFPIRRGSRCH